MLTQLVFYYTGEGRVWCAATAWQIVSHLCSPSSIPIPPTPILLRQLSTLKHHHCQRPPSWNCLHKIFYHHRPKDGGMKLEVELETLLLYRYFKNPCGFCLQMGRGWTARRESSVTGEGELWQEGKNHLQLLHLIIPGKNPSHTYTIPVATLGYWTRIPRAMGTLQCIWNCETWHACSILQMCQWVCLLASVALEWI